MWTALDGVLSASMCLALNGAAARSRKGAEPSAARAGAQSSERAGGRVGDGYVTVRVGLAILARGGDLPSVGCRLAEEMAAPQLGRQRR